MNFHLSFNPIVTVYGPFLPVGGKHLPDDAGEGLLVDEHFSVPHSLGPPDCHPHHLIHTLLPQILCH